MKAYLEMTCDEHADWIAEVARKPGVWQWARQYGRECEADDSGAYVGLLDKVRERLGSFRPAPGEARPWHEETTLEERIALAAKEKQGLRRSDEDGIDGQDQKQKRGRR